MNRYTVYIENTNTNEAIIESLIDRVPCFVTRTYVEMDSSKLEITCRAEDSAAVELAISCLVDEEV
jgi:hypothetical protein